MNIDFTEYGFIVLDFSVMLMSVEASLLDGLRMHENVFISSTFDAEARQSSIAAGTQDRRTYLKNVKQFDSVTLCRLPEEISSTTGDTYGLTCCLLDQGVSVLVICSNEQLKQKLLLDAVRCDILDPAAGQLVTNREQLRGIDEHTRGAAAVCLPYVEVSENSVLHDSQAKRVKLGKMLPSEGRESFLFTLSGNTNRVAKIFKQESLTDEKMENVKALARLGKAFAAKWALLPRSILYHDEGCLHPAGYLMDRVSDARCLDAVALFTGRTDDIVREHRHDSPLFPLQLALRLVRQMLWLSARGILVTDLNEGNFAVYPDSPDKPVAFLDTDSFSFNGYVSTVRAQDNLMREYDLTRKREVLHFVDEAVHILCFKLLTLGVQPLYNGRFRFRKDRTSHQFDYRWNLVPDNLQQVFIRVFEERKPHAIGELLHQMEVAETRFLQPDKPVPTFRELLAPQLYATRADDLGPEFSCVLCNGVRGKPRWELVNRVDGMPVLREERWDAQEMLWFRRNEDQTYRIESLVNGESACLACGDAQGAAGQGSAGQGSAGQGSAGQGSVGQGLAGQGSAVWFTADGGSERTKWRVEVLNWEKTDDGHDMIACLIGSEECFRLVLCAGLEGACSLKERDSGDAGQRFHIYMVGQEEHCSAIPASRPASPQRVKPVPVPVTAAVKPRVEERDNHLWLAFSAIALLFVALLLALVLRPRIDSVPDKPSAETATASLRSDHPAVRVETTNGYYFSEDGELEGYVEYHWDNGDVYKGSFVNGRRGGEGICWFANGDRYEGAFTDGAITGEGRYIVGYRSYEGSFVNASLDGIGRLYRLDGASRLLVYEGQFSGLYFQGEGTYYMPDETGADGGTNEAGGEPVENYFPISRPDWAAGGSPELRVQVNGAEYAEGHWENNVFHGSILQNGTWRNVQIVYGITIYQ